MRLTKHHGLGNDFLVTFDDVELTADLARRLCDRRRGIGADGVIAARSGVGGADLEMHLRNSDGSVAAMSGNGVRCLAQAAVLRDEQPLPIEGRTLAISTAAGMRGVTVWPGADRATCQARVGMGSVACGALPRPTPSRPPRAAPGG